MRTEGTEVEGRKTGQPLGVQRRSFLIGAPAALSACSVLTPVAVDGNSLKPGHGYLALQLLSSHLANLAFNHYGKRTFGSGLEDGLGGKGAVQFGGGESTVVLEVPAREYMWTLLWTAGLRQASIEANRFQVLPDAITYVGHLQLRLTSSSYRFNVTDHEERMRSYLRTHYPMAMQQLRFHKELTQLQIKSA